MTDPELQAAMQVLSVLQDPANRTDFHVFCLLVCRMVNVSTQHGLCGASRARLCLSRDHPRLGLSPLQRGYRFGKLACDLVDKHGFIAHRAKVHYAMGQIAFWTQPIASAIDFMRVTFRTAIETGDLTFACYGMFQSVTGFSCGTIRSTRCGASRRCAGLRPGS